MSQCISVCLSHSVERQSEFRLCRQLILGRSPGDAPQSPCFNKYWAVNLRLSCLPWLVLSWASGQVDNYSCSQGSCCLSEHLLRPVLVMCATCEQSQGSSQALLALLALLVFPKDCLGVIQNFLIVFMPENQAKSLHCIFKPFAQDVTSGCVPLCKNFLRFWTQLSSSLSERHKMT